MTYTCNFDPDHPPRGDDMTVTIDPFPTLTYILEYEQGDITDERFLELFEYLVDTGMAWTLQGHYGRTAIALIEAGLITPKEAS